MPFDPEWFAPHFEFRFPLVGEVAHRGIEIELRNALEPWHVLGEEPPAAARCAMSTARSSACRSRSTAPNDERHSSPATAVACRCTRPAQAGEYVAGVRYRAWQPARGAASDASPCMRRWCSTSTTAGASASIGGCTYHVAHPGGRNYDRVPVNANEAEARRRARFFPFGHTPGRLPCPRPSDNPASIR